MRDGIKSGSLLYVSDTESGDVYVFNYPKGTPAGTITGLTDPGGECVDAKGNVFVTNTGGSNVLEYAHGGTAPIATLKDPGFFPIGLCGLLENRGSGGDELFVIVERPRKHRDLQACTRETRQSFDRCEHAAVLAVRIRPDR